MSKRVRGAARDSERTKERIIDSAIDIFARKGFRGASTEAIAEQAGYGQATVFFHFSTKEGLLQACIERVRDILISDIHLDTLEGDITVLLRAIDYRFSDQKITSFLSRMALDTKDNDAILPMYAEMHRYIRDIVARFIEREAKVAGPDARFAAGMIMSMFSGVHLEYSLERQNFSREDYTQMLLLAGQMIVQRLSESGGKGWRRQSSRRST